MKRYKGRTVQVIVEPRGLEHEGRLYRTLSAAAKAVSGSHGNGFRFFGLGDAPMTAACAMKKVPTRALRCAISTRRSTEEGLAQGFNSLDARRESGAA